MPYIHKPTIIDAHCVNRERWPRWVSKAIAKGLIRVCIDGSMQAMTRDCNWRYALDGDYIVKDGEESFYVIRRKEFTALYEPLKKGD